MITHEERDRIILRRTLSAVAWICSLWSGLLASPLTGMPDPDVRRRGWLMLVHALFLAAAGVGLWKPRRWGWLATLAAGLGSGAFVAVDLLSRHWETAVVDALFPLLALAVFVKTRE